MSRHVKRKELLRRIEDLESHLGITPAVEPEACCPDAKHSLRQGGPVLHTGGCVNRCGKLVATEAIGAPDFYPCALYKDHKGPCWMPAAYRRDALIEEMQADLDEYERHVNEQESRVAKLIEQVAAGKKADRELTQLRIASDGFRYAIRVQRDDWYRTPGMADAADVLDEILKAFAEALDGDA